MEAEKYTIDSIEYYKEMYYKELERKKDFESLLTTPLLVYSFIVTINYFLVSELIVSHKFSVDLIVLIFMGLIGFLSIISIVFLLLFYDNFLSSYTYLEISNPLDILKMENDLKEEQESYKFAELHFIEKLKEKYAEYAGHNMKINVKRLDFFSLCKCFLILSLLMTIINALYIFYNYGTKI
ncbi:hypothetical protein [Chryseobacterium sp.]|uniref:hypothetical protein n=1 Tax=Chryseobacterium sp. TaxID=1871047 RepID=UPI00289FE94C|nr:hypothetical protein [Chryseobacterium sp.]